MEKGQYAVGRNNGSVNLPGYSALLPYPRGLQKIIVVYSKELLKESALHVIKLVTKRLSLIT